ncbi:hypothetical protein JQK87_30820 [Streptomyces sp. G44]|uniref:hypothetical protein n=1 Tax=Streptomyces sp. G44 TaxID=2807632 RepID=UPI001961F91E|nr:hypothetical protein [Streptomyces sp. G44]MBM7172704.1 hypothetical protein [Streptomyces sp. G44]
MRRTPVAVVVPADIADDHGTRHAYKGARALLTTRHPLLTCPGSHDGRAAFRAHLLGEPPTTLTVVRARTYPADHPRLAASAAGRPGPPFRGEIVTTGYVRGLARLIRQEAKKAAPHKEPGQAGVGRCPDYGVAAHAVF